MKENGENPWVQGLKEVADKPNDFIALDDQINAPEVRATLDECREEIFEALDDFNSKLNFESLYTDIQESVATVRASLPEHIPTQLEPELDHYHEELTAAIDADKYRLTLHERKKLAELVDSVLNRPHAQTPPFAEEHSPMDAPEEITSAPDRIHRFEKANNLAKNNIDDIFTEYDQAIAVNPERNLVNRLYPIFLRLRHEWEYLGAESEFYQSIARDKQYLNYMDTIVDIRKRINALNERGEISPEIAAELRAKFEKIFKDEEEDQNNPPPDVPPGE